MAGFKCPFCQKNMSLHFQTQSIHRVNFDSPKISPVAESPYLEVTIYRCPNDECQKESVFVHGRNGYIEDRWMPIYPPSQALQFPDYIPSPILCDYKEAHAIMFRSPKSAATLARRCLQGMIHDFWDIHEKNLNAEITQLKGRIPAGQWSAIDAVRKIGNIGAHMEHDVNRIIDVHPAEAEKLVRLIEHLLEKWYVGRHDEELLYSELTSISQEKAESQDR